MLERFAAFAPDIGFDQCNDGWGEVRLAGWFGFLSWDTAPSPTDVGGVTSAARLLMATLLSADAAVAALTELDAVITCVIIDIEDRTMDALKVTTVGNSTGVVIPKHILERLRVSKGDYLYLVEEPDGYKITPYNKEFIEQMERAEEVVREDRDVLKVLAK